MILGFYDMKKIGYKLALEISRDKIVFEHLNESKQKYLESKSEIMDRLQRQCDPWDFLSLNEMSSLQIGKGQAVQAMVPDMDKTNTLGVLTANTINSESDDDDEIDSDDDDEDGRFSTAGTCYPSSCYQQKL